MVIPQELCHQFYLEKFIYTLIITLGAHGVKFQIKDAPLGNTFVFCLLPVGAQRDNLTVIEISLAGLLFVTSEFLSVYEEAER